MSTWKEGVPEERAKQIALTDKQRENVRKMLEKFGGAPVDTAKKEVVESNEVADTVQDDLFIGVPPGTTIDWHSLTPGCKKYPFIREICCQFEPYIHSQYELTPHAFKKACTMLGLEPNNNSDSLITCSVDQADPITLLHIQVSSKQNGNVVIEKIRFIC